ncbi:MAG: hypothetical protein Q7W45_10505 [Bacteroidota bacterium]|nr:hypothetical protein [Bacteroidota bacterium]MDP3146483.1 hypothetical protein [Bacteroidota bacterium]
MSLTVQNKKQVELLTQLSNTTGLYSVAAKLCLENNHVVRNQFLLECYEQCHIPQANIYWGKKLVIEIINYNKMYNSNLITKQHEKNNYS